MVSSIHQQINEFVHKRTVTRHLLSSGVSNNKAFEWLRQMRFYFDPKQHDVLKKLSIHMADAKFNYGFEYLGVQEKLVQTPLTDKCYLTMTQALEARLGGSPFGPAGNMSFYRIITNIFLTCLMFIIIFNNPMVIFVCRYWKDGISQSSRTPTRKICVSLQL
jgi:hypothetical protein